MPQPISTQTIAVMISVNSSVSVSGVITSKGRTASQTETTAAHSAATEVTM